MTQPADLPAESSLDIAKLFEEHRRDLQRYAQQHLRDADLAEDAVQETFVAALRHPNFAGRSEVRTWLVAILKHKIVDIVRRRARIESVETSVPGAEEHEDLSELLFNPAGRWIEPPSDWGAPEQALQSKQLWAVFEECRRRMPQQQALVFSMREVMEMSTGEICEVLEITASNCHTTLYRARLRLQDCMNRNGFGGRRK